MWTIQNGISFSIRPFSPRNTIRTKPDESDIKAQHDKQEVYETW